MERTDDGVNLKDGVSRDRMMSVHDPEMRHGHKSSSRRFDGHKAAIVVDTDSQLITAVDVLPGNAPDNLGSLELVEASEANTGVPVEEAMGDAAYGDGDTRQAFADAGRRLVARVPGRPDRKHFPKDDFVIDLAAGSCTCPAGQVTHTIVPAGKRTGRRGGSTACRPSSSTGPNVGHVHCGPSASQPRGAGGGGCWSILRKPCCSRPERCSKALTMTNIECAEWWWNTGWPDWSSWAFASPAISAGSRPGSSCIWLPR